MVKYVRQEIGLVTPPEVIQFTPELLKTRSGKIMSRILRKIAAKDFENFGDISTLLNSDIVEYLIKNR
ncbi:MAG: hypothetical protein AB8V06_01820 [Francisella endosymbiont of Hyalomma asiaticum]